jgi:hypothetical protein
VGSSQRLLNALREEREIYPLPRRTRISPSARIHRERTVSRNRSNLRKCRVAHTKRVLLVRPSGWSVAGGIIRAQSQGVRQKLQLAGFIL